MLCFVSNNEMCGCFALWLLCFVSNDEMFLISSLELSFTPIYEP